MAELEEALRIRHFHRLPSSEEFSAEIEPSNVPAVFYGAIRGWEAISRWNPSDGGLDYLQERAGSVVVEAMLSKSAPVFYGDLRSHERVPVPFSAFITSCKSYQKEVVVLWPPSSSPLLYPMPIYGEASNHSAVDLINPDFSVHIRAVNSKEYSQEIVLHHGDALFIPEGWFHQVDSHDMTVAVNFWWKSSTISNMVEHMDAYYLRRILNRLVDKEMSVMLKSLEDCSKSGDHLAKIDVSKGDSHLESNDHRMYAEQNSKQFTLASDQLEPVELNVLYEIVSLVHENFGRSSHDDASGFTPKLSGANVEGDQKSTAAGSSSSPIASILWAVEPLVLQKVLLSMVNRFPRTLEALIIHMLSPAAAEVLTRKFDEMDREATNEQQQSEFYRQFYSVFDDQYAAMDSILHGKESFSFQAFCNVVDKYLGVSVDQDRSYHQGGRFR